jgi:hypothetical protein
MGISPVTSIQLSGCATSSAVCRSCSAKPKACAGRVYHGRNRRRVPQTALKDRRPQNLHARLHARASGQAVTAGVSLVGQREGRLPRRKSRVTEVSLRPRQPREAAHCIRSRLTSLLFGQRLDEAFDLSLEPGIAVGARDLPRGSRAEKVPSIFAVVAVGGVRLLAELAERRFVFALDLIEALTDEGKVIGYSCYHWEPLKHRGKAPSVVSL